MTAGAMTRGACGRLAACWQGQPWSARLLGLCPLLAVSTTLVKSATMAMLLVTVMAASGLLVSLLRNLITWRLRALFSILTVAMIVAIAAAGLQIARHQLVAELGIYVALLAGNCLVLNHVEEFANTADHTAVLRRLAAEGAGIVLFMVAMGAAREWLACGALLTDVHLLEHSLVDAGTVAARGPLPILGLPAGALLIFGLLLAAGNAWSGRCAASRTAPCACDSVGEVRGNRESEEMPGDFCASAGREPQPDD